MKLAVNEISRSCLSNRSLPHLLLHNQVFPANLSAEKMLLNDLFKHWRITTVVPGPLWIHDRNGTTRTNSQAIRLGPKNTTLLTQVEFLQPTS